MTTPTPPVILSQFRADFGEFKDSARYSDGVVQRWLTVAQQMFDPTRWGDTLILGIELYVAHQLVLSANAAEDAARGSSPGQSSGVLSSESVDKVSASYDVSAGTYKDAGWYNLTTYGVQLWSLIQMFGAGPVHIGADYSSPDGLGVQYPAGVGWSGPIF